MCESVAIPLTNGRFAIVDRQDYELVASARWWCNSSRLGRPAYVVTESRKAAGHPRHKIYMHRLIMGLGRGRHLQVDHINGDRLDNRRCNLRIVTNMQNSYNRGKSKNNSTGFKGVVWRADVGLFSARIQFERRYIYLGLTKTAEEASQLYVEAAKKYHGEFARISNVR